MTDIVGFMPTPFTSDDTVSTCELKELATRIADSGIFPAVLGGMGEFYALNVSEARSVMEAAVEGAAGRVPVVAGIGHDTRTAVELATAAAVAGIGIIVANPLYYAKPSPEGYAEHIRAVTEAAGLPAIVYSAGSYPITDRHIEALTTVEGFAGVKEEHFGVPETAERIRRWGERVAWWGVGEADGSEYVKAGAGTVTTSIANIAPQVAVEFITAAVSGTTVSPTAARAIAAWDALMANSVEGVPSFLKEAMRLSAGWSGSVRQPLRAADPRTSAGLEALLGTFPDSERTQAEASR